MYHFAAHPLCFDLYREGGLIFMALGFLVILTITILLLAIVGIILLLTVKNKKYVNVVFGANIVLSLILTYLHATSLPTNFHLQIAIAYGFGLLAIIAFILKFGLKKYELLAKYLVILSIVGGVYGILF